MKQITDAPDHAQKALVFQQNCAPEMWAELTKRTTPENYKVFTGGLDSLTEVIKSGQGA